MIEKKPTLVAVIVALAIIGTPLAASAVPQLSFKEISGISIHSEDHGDDDEHEDDDDDDDDDHHSSIPPVFVVPGKNSSDDDDEDDDAKTSFSNQTPSTNTNSQTSTGTGTVANAPASPTAVNSAGASNVKPASGGDFVVVSAGEDPRTDSLGGVNPEEAGAVDIKRVSRDRISPAEQFLDAAYIGMGMLGVAALGLGATAGVRAIRLRRSGKSDYFYGDK